MQLGERHWDFGRRIAIMAVVNRTPDSFYDRGATFALDTALARAEQHVAAGADLVDVGGVKAGPGTAVGQAEELDRVVGFVAAFRARCDVALSVDTFRPAVAQAALEAGADVINDVTGLSEPEVADVVASHPGSALVVTHHGGTPRSRPFRRDYEPDVMTAVRRRCAQLVQVAMDRGVERDQILVDPGHDMGKTTAHSIEVTRRIGELADLGLPVLVAVSNKDFIGESVGLELTERRDASLAAALYCVLHGARVVRVHDARATVRAVRMIEVILGWRDPVTALRGLD